MNLSTHSLTLLIYCTFSASMLKLSLFLNCSPKKCGGTPFAPAFQSRGTHPHFPPIKVAERGRGELHMPIFPTPTPKPQFYYSFRWREKLLFGQLCKFLLRKPNVLFDFLVMLFMCGFQERFLLSVTPRYLLCGTFSKSWLCILYSKLIFVFFVPAVMMKHLSALKDICHSFSKDSSAFRSFCKSCPSEILLISLYRRQSSANNFTLAFTFSCKSFM